jgi:hypothetical protein
MVTDFVPAFLARKEIGVGSPPKWDYMLQAGSGALGAGSTVWVSYGKEFGGVPIVVLTNITSINKVVQVKDKGNAGSFQAAGEAASDEFMWMAVGKKKA